MSKEVCYELAIKTACERLDCFEKMVKGSWPKEHILSELKAVKEIICYLKEMWDKDD